MKNLTIKYLNDNGDLLLDLTSLNITRAQLKKYYAKNGVGRSFLNGVDMLVAEWESDDKLVLYYENNTKLIIEDVEYFNFNK